MKTDEKLLFQRWKSKKKLNSLTHAQSRKPLWNVEKKQIFSKIAKKKVKEIVYNCMNNKKN